MSLILESRNIVFMFSLVGYTNQGETGGDFIIIYRSASVASFRPTDPVVQITFVVGYRGRSSRGYASAQIMELSKLPGTISSVT